MDPIYAHAQVQHTVWANPVHSVMPMDYSTYPHPPPFTSPPATPMTPITPVTLHHAFPMPHQYEMTAPGAVYHNPPPPPPPPFPSPPEFSHPDYRLYALCQHLQNYSKVQESQHKAWWEEFLNEFFQDNATLVIEVDFGEGTRKYRLTGNWIGLYFKSLMENGVTSVHLNLDQCYTTPNQNLWQLECQNAVMETHHSTPKPTKVCMSGSLVVDFSLEEKPRIISWYFHIKDHVEFVPRSTVGQGEESGIMGNITCRGILPATQKLLLEAGMLENTGYHESTSIAMTSTATPTINTAMHWQDSVPPLIHHPQHIDVLAGPLGVMAGAVLSPDPRLNPSMNGSSSSSGGKQQQQQTKTSRSSSHHGSGSHKKKSSPIPAAQGGSNAGKDHFVLVAAEAMPLGSAEDFLSAYSIDERTITRVNNKGKSCATESDVSNGHHIINGQTASSATGGGTTSSKMVSHITHLPRPDACLPDGGAAHDNITSSPLPPMDSSWSTPTDTLAISVTGAR